MTSDIVNPTNTTTYFAPPIDNSEVDEIKILKKTLFKLWKLFKRDDFFFVGVVVGRHSYQKLYQLADEYNLGKDAADSFLALQLKRYDYKFLRDSVATFTDKEVNLALRYLKRFTAELKFIPAVLKLKSLRKFFADPPFHLYPLAALFVAHALKIDTSKSATFATESSARQYFNLYYDISDDDFDFQVFNLMEIKPREENGTRWLPLYDLAELETIICDEHCLKNSPEDFWLAFKELNFNDN